MNDTYIRKVTGTEASDGLLHHCGTVSVCVEVECAMAERLLYCPECDIFWGQDEDYWGDEKTEWEIEKPAPQTNFVELVKTKDGIISRLMEKLKTKDRLLSGAHQGIKARDNTATSLLQQIQELNKQIDGHLKDNAVQRDTIQRYNELVGELRQHYPANNEVLDEMENRIL